jgi:serine/threonine protein kinase
MNASLNPEQLSAATPAPARALPPGSVVEGFEIVRVVASSDLCIDYLAIAPQDATSVVLVEYMPQRLARRKGTTVWPLTPPDADALGRGLLAFIDEARMLAGIHHPSLLRVSGVIQANATAYQITPSHAGTSLLQVRQAMEGPADERALRTLLGGALDGLEAMHSRGLLHGGVAPGSILVRDDDRPLLLGPERARAEVASGLVESLMARVEPSFAAPEQREPASGHALGAWTDLYSLAETMRFCIGGESPPPATAPREPGRREPTAQMVRRLFGPLSPVRYSTGLMDVLDAALETSPTGRPQSVAEFRAALGKMPEEAPPARAAPRTEPAFNFDPIPPRAPAEAPPAWHASDEPPAAFRPPPEPPRRWWPWAAGVLALVLAVGGYVWWHVDPFAHIQLPAVIAPSTPIHSTPAPEPTPTPTPTPIPMPMPITEPAPPPVLSQEAPMPAAAPPTASPPTPEPQPQPPPMQTQTQPPIVAAPTPAPPVVTKPAPPVVTKPAPPVRAKPAAPPSPPAPASPRDACAGRTQFSLYRCMQTQCEQRGWTNHPQCERLRATDSVE